MGKPFQGTWAVLIKIGRRWIASSHRFWFKSEAEEYAAARADHEAHVVKDELVEPTLTLLNG